MRATASDLCTHTWIQFACYCLRPLHTYLDPVCMLLPPTSAHIPGSSLLTSAHTRIQIDEMGTATADLIPPPLPRIQMVGPGQIRRAPPDPGGYGGYTVTDPQSTCSHGRHTKPPCGLLPLPHRSLSPLPHFRGWVRGPTQTPLLSHRSSTRHTKLRNPTACRGGCATLKTQEPVGVGARPKNSEPVGVGAPP